VRTSNSITVGSSGGMGEVLPVVVCLKKWYHRGE
jgi:hypothetical protein